MQSHGLVHANSRRQERQGLLLRLPLSLLEYVSRVFLRVAVHPMTEGHDFYCLIKSGLECPDLRPRPSKQCSGQVITPAYKSCQALLGKEWFCGIPGVPGMTSYVVGSAVYGVLLFDKTVTCIAVFVNLCSHFYWLAISLDSFSDSGVPIMLLFCFVFLSLFPA